MGEERAAELRDGAPGADLRPEQVDALLQLSSCFDQSESDVIAFDRLLTALKGMIGFSSCSIHLLDGHGEEMYLIASRDVPESIPEAILEATRHESLESSYMKPLLAKEPYRPTEHIARGEQMGSVQAESIFQGEMVKVPLLSAGRLVGAMTIIKSGADERWFASHKRWLAMIGAHLGSLIEQRVDNAVRQSTASLREREWMSRELNDRLLQYASAIRLAAERARLKWEAREMASMAQCLRDIEELAADVYADIREEMISLAFIGPADQDILGRMREYLARFQQQWGVQITFTVVDPTGALDHIRGPAAQLFRITQEALTNVRLHAGATQAEVSLETDGRTLRMLVIDNGRGFDAAQVPPEKMGLKVMAERAAEIGGVLTTISSPDEGTVISLEVKDFVSRLRARSSAAAPVVDAL